MSQIVFYLLHSTLVLSFHIDVVLTLMALFWMFRWPDVAPSFLYYFLPSFIHSFIISYNYDNHSLSSSPIHWITLLISNSFIMPHMIFFPSLRESYLANFLFSLFLSFQKCFVPLSSLTFLLSYNDLRLTIGSPELDSANEPSGLLPLKFYIPDCPCCRARLGYELMTSSETSSFVIKYAFSYGITHTEVYACVSAPIEKSRFPALHLL